MSSLMSKKWSISCPGARRCYKRAQHNTIAYNSNYIFRPLCTHLLQMGYLKSALWIGPVNLLKTIDLIGDEYAENGTIGFCQVWHTVAFKAELSRIASVASCRILTGIDFTLWRPVFVYKVAEGVFWWLFLILNALPNPMFEADERENQDTLCKIKPRLHGQGGFSSKDSVRSWSPKQFLHFISPSASSVLSLKWDLLQSDVQSRRTAFFYECITEQHTGRIHALDKLLIKPPTWYCMSWGLCWSLKAPCVEVALSSSPLREFSFQDAAGRVWQEKPI